MQAKELCNISISPLVVTPFCTQWSGDNHISIITEKGVHVFELIPAPTSPQPTFRFSRSFINPSEILPAKSFEEEIDSVIWTLERKELYLFLMEEAITPSVDGARDIEPRVISLAWSPWRLINPCRCLLATVSSAGAVDILFKVSRNWFSACDLSTVWLNEVYGISGEDIRNKFKKGGAHKLQNYLRRLQATAITWSDLNESGKEYFAYLVSAYRNSEIAVWHVSGISSASEEIKPSIVFKIVMESEERINSLKWVNLDNKILIVVGYLNGQVDGLLLDFLDNKFGNHTVNKFWADADHIPIDCIEIWNSAEYGKLVVVCKGSFLLTHKPTHDGNIENTQFIHVEGFFISGLVEASDKELIISTQDGSLLAVSFKNKQLVYNNIDHNLLSSNVQYLGLSCSLNKSLFLNITSPNVMHDHLINREPSTMCIFIMEGRSGWNSVDMLKKNESKSLTRHWDCLESIRVQILRSQDSCDMLPPIPENFDKLSEYELRIAMWTSMIAEAFEKKKFPRRNTSIIGEISDAHPLIFLRLATARLVGLGAKENLSTDQRLCASLLRSYIEVYLAGEEEEEDESVSVQEAKKALNLTNHLSSVEPESCDICGEIITELSWKTTTCPSGHKLPRCAITLLQVSSINYRSCPICGQILHPCLDKEYDEPLCPYCEIPTIYDSRVLDTKRKSSLPDRNFSKRRISALPQSKTQGADKQSEKNEEITT